MKFSKDRVESEVKPEITKTLEEIQANMNTLKLLLEERIGGLNDDDTSKCWTGNAATQFLEKFNQLNETIKTNYGEFMHSLNNAIESHGQSVQDVDSQNFSG